MSTPQMTPEMMQMMQMMMQNPQMMQMMMAQMSPQQTPPQSPPAPQAAPAPAQNKWASPQVAAALGKSAGAPAARSGSPSTTSRPSAATSQAPAPQQQSWQSPPLWSPPAQGFSQPAQTFSPPAQMWAPPQQMWGAAQQSFAPSAPSVMVQQGDMKIINGSKLECTFIVDEIPFHFNGNINPSIKSVTITEAFVHFSDPDDLTTQRQFKGRIGKDTVELVIANGVKLTGKLDMPLNPPSRISGAGTWVQL